MDIPCPAQYRRRTESAAGPIFTIAGYYGFGNIGDDAILASMLADLRREFPQARFDILSDRYVPITESPGVRTILWRDWTRVIQSVAGCDLLIVGGGGLFNYYLDYNPDELLTQSTNLAPFIFGLPVLARLLRKPCCIYGVGASAFNSPAALHHARLAVRLADVCTVRDAVSREILEGDSGSFHPIAVTADPAFRLENVDPKTLANHLSAAAFEALPRTVVVVFRNWTFGPDRSWELHLAAALREFAAERGLRVLFVPFHSLLDAPFDLNNDRSAIDRLSAHLGDAVEYEALSNQLSPGEVSAIFSRCAMVVGMRLHACILAVRNAVPFLGLAYDAKVRNVMAHCGLDRFVLDPGEFTAERLRDALDAAFLERVSIREEVARAAARMAGMAYENVAAVKRALARQAPREVNEAEYLPFLEQLALKQTRLLAACSSRVLEVSSLFAASRQAVRALMEASQFERALGCLEQLISAQPSCGEWHYLKALCVQSLNRDPAIAFECYERALAGGFDPFWVFYNRSQLHVSIRQLSAAAEDLEAAARLMPDHPGIPVVRQRIEDAMGRRPRE